MSGYHTERYETTCTDCERTIRTVAPERNRSRGVMIRCKGTGCDCEPADCDCEECGHINFTRTVAETDHGGGFEGVLL